VRARVILIGLIALVGACGGPPPTYSDQIATWHAEKDRFMRESPDSPVLSGKRPGFPPLSYFPVDPSYRIPAALQLAPPGPVVDMPTSTGVRRPMHRVGTLAFTLAGHPLMTLGAFVEADDKEMRRLFVPFSDLTSGLETYQGGRYLDLDRTPTGFYDLDFNRAYHPFCLFNPAYECPYPPAENRLKTPIRAGERLQASAR
jgi:uncharacterized protein (DUF1684 family)